MSVESKPNATAATLTKNRTPDSVVKISGMCATCVDGCIGMCEIGKSAYRGVEAIYPQPFGMITAAGEKTFPVDMGHFTVLGTCCGAQGIEADSDKAVFPAVTTDVTFGHDKGLKLKMPLSIPGLGSTAVAKNNWDGLAIGAAMSGVMLTIGENVCGMDPDGEIKDGRVVRSPDMERRVKLYKDWQDGGYGAIVVQSNVEDTRLKVQEYALEKLGVEVVELKWGQGAKDIGGEVKLKSMDRAKTLKDRGYVVLPDPYKEGVAEAFERHTFHEFERHSRLGMVTEDSFHARVEEVRKAGAKYVFLKTGAYRPRDLALALKVCSDSKIDLLTVDGAGGGTGMSPWRMMCEWGVPGVELWSLTREYCDRLAKKGKHVPAIAFAGGLILEDHIFKALALGAPYTKIVGMARGPLAAAMVGKNIGQRLNSGDLPVYVGRFGHSVEEVFITAPDLKRKYGKDFERIAPGAIGLYTYFDRLAQGLKQLMAGARKFTLGHIERDDLASLTKEGAEVSGLKYIMDVDKEESLKILDA